MADEHLELRGHGEAATTVKQCCSDQIAQQSAIRAPPLARWEGEFARNSGGEHRHRTGHADLLDLTMSRSRAPEPKQAGAGTRRISWPMATSATLGTILCTEERAERLEAHQRAAHAFSQE